MPILLLVFIVIPIIEVFFLIQVGHVIGAWSTIGLVILTAVLGSILLRMEGLATLFRFQRTLNQGELPAFELLEGLLLLIGGALLLTPGFFTDAIGFICLLPFTRRPLIRWAVRRGLLHMHGQVEQHARHRSEHVHVRYRRLDDD